MFDLETIEKTGVVLPHKLVSSPESAKGINPVSLQGPTLFSEPIKKCGKYKQLPVGHFGGGGQGDPCGHPLQLSTICG